jgi:hypothetical protein
MTKLTLSVDAHVVAGAKQYARARGTSVSKLVETLLRLLSSRPAGQALRATLPFPPVLTRLRGSVKRGGAVRDYHRYLERKYR